MMFLSVRGIVLCAAYQTEGCGPGTHASSTRGSYSKKLCTFEWTSIRCLDKKWLPIHPPFESSSRSFGSLNLMLQFETRIFLINFTFNCQLAVLSLAPTNYSGTFHCYIWRLFSMLCIVGCFIVCQIQVVAFGLLHIKARCIRSFRSTNDSINIVHFQEHGVVWMSNHKWTTNRICSS